jgi:hypothetical protein
MDRAVVGAAQRYSEFVAPLAAERPRLCVAKMRASDGLPVLKSGFCVSTVSIVCGRAPRSMAVVSGCTYWTARRLARPMIVIVIADDADGADGIFRPRMDPDYPGSSSPFTTEANVDAQYPKECLRTTQSAGEVPGALGPNRGPAREAGTRQGCTGTQEVGSTSRPRAAVRHNLPQPSGHWIGVD